MNIITIINFRVSYKAGHLLTSRETVVLQRNALLQWLVSKKLQCSESWRAQCRLDKERFSASFDEANTLKHNHFMRTVCEFKELEVLEKKFRLYSFRFQYSN
jgi:hypothetical protein